MLPQRVVSTIKTDVTPLQSPQHKRMLCSLKLTINQALIHDETNHSVKLDYSFTTLS